MERGPITAGYKAERATVIQLLNQTVGDFKRILNHGWPRPGQILAFAQPRGR